MAVFRIEKTRDYTVMANHHLRNTALSLKAKGLLSLMLSFLKLNSSHIEYVLDRMRENTTYVRNIKKYLLAALYNAPATIDSYYASLVNHDLYGSGERR